MAGMEAAQGQVLIQEEDEVSRSLSRAAGGLNKGAIHLNQFLTIILLDLYPSCIIYLISM